MAERNITSPEGILMLFIAALLDLLSFGIFIIEVWFDLGIIATLVAWLSSLLILVWMYARGSLSLSSLVVSQVETASNMVKNESGKQNKASGSGNIKDWQQNKNGVWTLKNNQESSPNNTKPPPGNAGKATGAIKSLAKKIGWSYFIEFVPIIQNFWPGLTIRVWKTLWNDDTTLSSTVQNKKPTEEKTGGKETMAA